MKINKNLARFALPSFLIAAAAIVAACGGGTPAPESANAGAEAAQESPQEGAVSEGPLKFDDMSAPQKMKHMKEVVSPAMAKVFQESGGYEDFGCSTCHGSGAKAGNFEMPSADIPALDQEEMDEHPEVTKFMQERVTPEMAKLLGEEPYNPETQQGFGCYGCHTKK